MPKLNISIQFASSQPRLPSKSQFRKWAKAALRVDTEVTIRIVDEDEARILNSAYRGKDYATNVLTFPIAEEPHLMGDIVICAPVVETEAKAQNKPLEAHYAHLTVHGITIKQNLPFLTFIFLNQPTFIATNRNNNILIPHPNRSLILTINGIPRFLTLQLQHQLSPPL